MCAIAGEINYHKSFKGKEAYLDNMLSTMKRRGPDQDDVYLCGPVALLHARLSVIDLENGKQPMKARVGEREYVIVYNGELYNTDEVKRQLIEKGARFESRSDTEVLLKAYIAWGEACVEKLNGIFAFAVWEAQEQRLFIARDRMGVKPFFYVVREGQFLFASEIKTLLAHPDVDAAIDIDSIAEIMLVGPGRTPGYGVFKGIQELCPGCCGYFSESGLHTVPYWTLRDREHADSFSQTVEKVRYLVTDSIERQLVSDVPVCTFLSGGLDSSIISAVANRYLAGRGRQLHTFSVGYRDNEKYFRKSKFQPDSDESYIAIMNDFLNAKHHQITLDTPALVQALFDAVDARDLPGMADVDASLLLFCREIKKEATVALSGECADEIFGGYPWFRDAEIREREGFPWAQSTAYRAGFLKDAFASRIDPACYVGSRYRSSLKQVSKRPGLSPVESRMKEMVYLNQYWFMQTLLDRKDRMSMYNGLEVRVPFCDYRIAEYLYSVPWAYKDYQNTEKGLLRQAMAGLLPEKVLWRRKSPYPKTHNPSYMKAVSSLLLETVSDPDAPILQFVKKEALIQLTEAQNMIPWYGQLMTTPQTIAYFLQINYWLEKYRISIV